MALPKDLEADGGTTFDWGFNYVRSKVEGGIKVPDVENPYDLTGCSARMQVRAKITDAEALVSLHTGAGGGLTIDPPAEGRVDIQLTDLQTAIIAAVKPGKDVAAVYDLELVWPAVGSARPRVQRLLEGKFTVSPGVTRDNNLPPDGVDDE